MSNFLKQLQEFEKEHGDGIVLDSGILINENFDFRGDSDENILQKKRERIIFKNDYKAPADKYILNKLKQYWGYESFRGKQLEIVKTILSGRNTLVLMPTGGGKSLTFQIPAIMLPGVTIVISPLIALMQDQVDKLNGIGIEARFINSTQNFDEIKDIKNEVVMGIVKILYIAPERLQSEFFIDFIKDVNVSLLAVDEAHCISEWGNNFRPEYRNISKIRDLFPDIPTIALTASATHKVRQDIIKNLRIEDAQIFTESFNRENISYTILPKKKDVSLGQILTLIKDVRGAPVIIYTLSRKDTKSITTFLKNNGVDKVGAYHAGLSDVTRKSVQKRFLNGKLQVIVATIAFGMGVDKKDIRLVIHFSIPKSVESYYQETGRAGRDGKKSRAVLFFSLQDKTKQMFFIRQLPYHQRHTETEKLNEMVKIISSGECRRKAILKYLGEEYTGKCSGCDICNPELRNIKISSYKIKNKKKIVKTKKKRVVLKKAETKSNIKKRTYSKKPRAVKKSTYKTNSYKRKAYKKAIKTRSV